MYAYSSTHEVHDPPSMIWLVDHESHGVCIGGTDLRRGSADHGTGSKATYLAQ